MNEFTVITAEISSDQSLSALASSPEYLISRRWSAGWRLGCLMWRWVWSQPTPMKKALCSLLWASCRVNNNQQGPKGSSIQPLGLGNKENFSIIEVGRAVVRLRWGCSGPCLAGVWGLQTVKSHSISELPYPCLNITEKDFLENLPVFFWLLT